MLKGKVSVVSWLASSAPQLQASLLGARPARDLAGAARCPRAPSHSAAGPAVSDYVEMFRVHGDIHSFLYTGSPAMHSHVLSLVVQVSSQAAAPMGLANTVDALRPACLPCMCKRGHAVHHRVEHIPCLGGEAPWWGLHDPHRVRLLKIWRAFGTCFLDRSIDGS